MWEFEGNRVVRDTGARYPIFNAPIGSMARAEWAGAVSAAGGMGLMESMLQDSASLQEQSNIIRARTPHPFGVGLVPQWLEAKPEHETDVLNWLSKGSVKFVTVYTGQMIDQQQDPWRYVKTVQAAGAKIYHAVETVDAALRSEDEGVDGLILTGAESGGVRRRHNDLQIFSFLQKVRKRCQLPLVASGGIADGYGMAAAFALGAEGILMGTRFMASRECPIHDNVKQELARAEAVSYVDYGRPHYSMLSVRNAYSDAVDRGDVKVEGKNPYAGDARKMFWEGRTDMALLGAGESATLFDSVKPVAEIIDDTIGEFWSEIERIAALLRPSSAAAYHVETKKVAARPQA